ncbi:MAG: spore maturation protein [Clostridiales bacterium]|nr:spore maturation protein [Clostridiales bacterium]
MSKIWLIMLLSAISTALVRDPSIAVSAMLTGAKDSVELAMELVAVYGVWLGFFALLDKTGFANVIAKLLRPLIKFLFKGSSEEAQKYISMNMSANLIGLGNAATPMGINAVKLLGDEKESANTNVIMLVVISATSLQLLPTTVISMRAAHGSANAADFLLPCIIATIISTVIGIALVKFLSKLFPDDRRK